VFSPAGAFISKFGTEGNGNGQLYYPSGVAIDQEGRIIVSQWHCALVHVFSRDGEFIYKFASEGTSDGQLKGAGGLAIDLDGNILVADSGNDRVQVFQL